MAFWGKNQQSGDNLKDPKRNFRFIVSFGGLEQGKSTAWWAKTAAKPSFTIAAAEHKYLNHTFYYPGSVTWNTVTIGMVDPVQDVDTTATIADILQAGGYTPPTNPDVLQTMSKSKVTRSLGSVKIQQLDGDGNELETWTLVNAWIQDVKFGDTLEYGNDELTQVDITLQYDWATLESKQASSKSGGTGADSTYFNGPAAT
jgi:hypothetical protein